MFNAKSLKNTGIITELTSNPAEVTKKAITNRRIPLEDFPIFSKSNPMNVMMNYFASCQAGALDKASKTHSKKRKISMKHDDGRPKMVKTSSFSRRTLDTAAEELRVVVATPSAGNVYSKSTPS